jgi:hypothetical protein
MAGAARITNDRRAGTQRETVLPRNHHHGFRPATVHLFRP